MRLLKTLLSSTLLLSIIACSETPKQHYAGEDSVTSEGAEDSEIRPGSEEPFMVHFAFDKSILTDEYKVVIDEVVDLMHEHPDVTASLIGHTDHVGGVDYNLALGGRRAKTVFDYMVSKDASLKTRLSKLSMGASHPIAEGHDPESMAMNRRTEIILNYPAGSSQEPIESKLEDEQEQEDLTSVQDSTSAQDSTGVEDESSSDCNESEEDCQH